MGKIKYFLSCGWMPRADVGSPSLEILKTTQHSPDLRADLILKLFLHEKVDWIW